MLDKINFEKLACFNSLMENIDKMYKLYLYEVDYHVVEEYRDSLVCFYTPESFVLTKDFLRQLFDATCKADEMYYNDEQHCYYFVVWNVRPRNPKFPFEFGS